MTHSDRGLNLNDVWARVSEGIERIYRNEEMSPHAYMELYTHVCNYCTNTTAQAQPSRQSSRPAQKVGSNQRQNTVHDGANIGGDELYAELKNY
ncbi:unnamed protein product [Rotaria sp. Silwood2]|nr:unnamed protein product [Rotaria sp. Silwood2]CAF3477569.1 unnamed protein product [Rotaria sp. Silwood2]CAF3980795.1 unnamed protein product [Rotaria sp. Silwood2]CAF4545704.1 unnamed protein product [Rotaria sp. Silwood2]